MCMLCLCGEDSTRLAAFSFFHLGRRLSLCQGLAAPPPPPAMGNAQISLGLPLGSGASCHLERLQLFMPCCFTCSIWFCCKDWTCFHYGIFFSFPVRVLRGVLCLQCGRLGRFPSCSWFLTCPTIRTCVNTTDLLTVEGRFMVLIAPCMITKSV